MRKEYASILSLFSNWQMYNEVPLHAYQITTITWDSAGKQVQK